MRLGLRLLGLSGFLLLGIARGAFVVLSAFSARGHVAPLLPLAAELHARGHRVALAVPDSAVAWVTAELSPVVGPTASALWEGERRVAVLSAGAEGRRGGNYFPALGRAGQWLSDVQDAPELSRPLYAALLAHLRNETQRPAAGARGWAGALRS